MQKFIYLTILMVTNYMIHLLHHHMHLPHLKKRVNGGEMSHYFQKFSLWITISFPLASFCADCYDTALCSFQVSVCQ